MKKHLDWKRIWWTTFVPLFTFIFTEIFYHHVSKNWATYEDLYDGIVPVPPSTQIGFAILLGLIAMLLLALSIHVIPDIIHFYYHNNEEEK